MEQAQERLALSHRNVCEQLLQEVEKRRKRGQIPKPPTRALSTDDSLAALDPLKLLQRMQRNPMKPPVTAERAEGMVEAMEQTLKALTSPVLDLSLPEEGKDPRLVVVGDVHGQLQDVLHIFKTHGPPSEEVVYLFNGDIVDRGRYACEIWLLIIAFKLAHPRSVYVLRGNHENEQMIIRPFKMGGGFAEECLSKYGQPVLSAFQRMFKLLPLFAVLEQEIFVVHGGLFRDASVTLQTLRDLPAAAWRRNYPNPLSSEQVAKGEKWTMEEEILFDAQWADPHYGSGSRPSSRGRVAVTFGTDVTQRFLDDAGLALCLRSHRVPQSGRGFEPEHNGRLLTLFSASRYGGVLQNRGAVAVLRRADGSVQDDRNDLDPGDLGFDSSSSTASPTPLKRMKMQIVEHDVNPLKGAADQQSVAAATACQVRRVVEQQSREQENDMEQHALALICVERSALWSRCYALDTGRTGLLERNAFCDLLSEVCGELSWSAILSRAAPWMGAQEVAYGEFLSTPSVRWFHHGAAAVVTMARASAQAELRLSGLVALFDSTSGLVTPELAREALGQLLPSLRERERHQLATALFGEENSKLSDVLHQLALFADPPDLTEPWMEPALRRLSTLVEKHHGPPPLHSALIRFFRAVAVDGSDLIQPEEFVKGFQNLGAYHCSGDHEVPLLHTGRLYKLFEVIDGNGSGTVSFLELLLAMDNRADRPELPELPALEGALPALLLVHKAALLRMCRDMDPADAGRISVSNFMGLVTALGDVLGRPFAPCERSAIEEELEGSEDLAYSELLGGFQVHAEGGPFKRSGANSRIE